MIKVIKNFEPLNINNLVTIDLELKINHVYNKVNHVYSAYIQILFNSTQIYVIIFWNDNEQALKFHCHMIICQKA
jgi:hypothetical protein